MSNVRQNIPRPRRVYINEINDILNVDFGVDISGKDTYQLILKRPVTREVFLIDSVDLNTNGCSIDVTLSEGTFDVPGYWEAQARFITGSVIEFSVEFEIEVADSLDAITGIVGLIEAELQYLLTG